MKRLSYVIFTAFVLFIGTLSVNAAILADVNILEGNYKKGDEVKISFVLKGIDKNGLSSTEFHIKTNGITYKCDNVKYSQVVEGEMDCMFDDTTGSLNLLYVDSEMGKSPIKDGELFTLITKSDEDIESKNIIKDVSFTGLSQVVGEKVVTLDSKSKVNYVKTTTGSEDTEEPKKEETKPDKKEEFENPNTGYFIAIGAMLIAIVITLVVRKKFAKYKRFGRV